MKFTSNTLIDNSTNYFMRDALKEFFDSNEFNTVLIATGYWDLPGMNLIKKELRTFLEKDGSKLKLLIGEDPRVRIYQQINPTRKDPKFPEDYIKQDIHSLKENLVADYQEIINILFEYCNETVEDSKIEIRVFRNKENKKTQFLHSKCYIFEGKTIVRGIIGSSNFTAKGLEGNAELNYLETDPLRVCATGETATGKLKTHHTWFFEKWEESEKWNKTFLTEILKTSPIGKKVLEEKKNKKLTTPYEIYIRYLQHFFDSAIDSEKTKSLEEFLPTEIKKLTYQFSAVNQAYSIMKAHGGFILADVVGLGKTITAILLIKKFLDEHFLDNRNKKVLIITPPAIKSSWLDTIKLFEKNENGDLHKKIEFITTGKVVDIDNTILENYLSPELDTNIKRITEYKNNKSYGLIIIDESHNFRNETSKMYKALDVLIGNIEPQPYIGLLSATPQNNSPKDLKNQIYLFQRQRQKTTLSGIPGRKLDTYFSEKEKDFFELRKKKDNQKELIALAKDIREKVLSQLVVRRTRTDLKKFYDDDVKNLNFPEIKGPTPIKYIMPDKLAKLFSDTMNIIAKIDDKSGHFIFDNETLHFYRYRAIEYLKSEEHREIYGKKINVKDVSARLARLMQVQLVKRLESSFAAFKKSLENLKIYTDNMIKMLENDTVFICPDLDINKEFSLTNDFNKACENIKKKMEKKPSNNICFSADDFDPKYLDYLKQDYKILEELCSKWSMVSYDPKLEAFKKAINNSYSENYIGNKIDLFDKQKNNPNKHDKQKLVIFTEAVATAEELSRTIENLGYTSKVKRKVLTITSENRENDKDKIKENFDANSEVQKNDYDILITTDVLAEGVNLHRANTILNYDTPWNATRLMQRIGRVNRIGSKESNVYVYNFMPTAESESLISLVNIAHAKLQSFHTMFGEDNPVLTGDEEVHSFGRAPTEKELNELLDGEESEQEKYIAELRELKTSNPKEYERILKLKLPLISSSQNISKKSLVFVKSKNSFGDIFLITESAKDTQKIGHNDAIKILDSLKNETAKYININFIEAIKAQAIKLYREDKQAIVLSKQLSKAENEAIDLCVTISRHVNISDFSKNLLTKYRSDIRKGDRTKAKRIIKLNQAIEKEISNSSTELFNTDINELIKNFLTIQSQTHFKDSSEKEEFFFIIAF